MNNKLENRILDYFPEDGKFNAKAEILEIPDDYLLLISEYYSDKIKQELNELDTYRIKFLIEVNGSERDDHELNLLIFNIYVKEDKLEEAKNILGNLNLNKIEKPYFKLNLDRFITIVLGVIGLFILVLFVWVFVFNQ